MERFTLTEEFYDLSRDSLTSVLEGSKMKLMEHAGKYIF